MDIRNSLEGLKSLLGVTAPAPAAPHINSSTSATNALNSDSATVSGAGSQVSLTAAESDVRPEKVAAIQSALAAGTYNVPSSAVASKVVDSLLGGEQDSAAASQGRS